MEASWSSKPVEGSKCKSQTHKKLKAIRSQPGLFCSSHLDPGPRTPSSLGRLCLGKEASMGAKPLCCSLGNTPGNLRAGAPADRIVPGYGGGGRPNGSVWTGEVVELELEESSWDQLLEPAEDPVGAAGGAASPGAGSCRPFSCRNVLFCCCCLRMSSRSR